MSKGFVKVQLLGNLGKDPEVRTTAGGNHVANLRVACTERAKQQDGTWGDKTEWVSVVVFGKTAENVGQFLAKGSQIYGDGRLQTREWTDKEGNKRYNTEVVVNDLIFLGKKGDRDAGAQASYDPNAPGPDVPPARNAEDDIPF